MELLYVLKAWLALVLNAFIEPSDEALARTARERRERLLREATRRIYG
jgi:hypothetical protein